MLEFITSGKGSGFCIVILIILGIIYGVVVAYDSYIDDEFDPVTEAKCKKCILYDMCRKHGLDYNCKEYMTEEMLQKKGLYHETEKRRTKSKDA